MKTKIFAFLKARIFVILITISLLAFLGLLVYLFAEKIPGTEETIQTNQASSQTDVRTADTLEKQQAVAEVERRTEDGVREKVIVPKLQAARAKSARSAQEIKILKQKIKENEKTIDHINASLRDNCNELHRRFPDKRFEYCRD